MEDKDPSKPKKVDVLKKHMAFLIKKPIGVFFLAMLFFGIMLGGVDRSAMPEELRILPIYGVFIIPAIVGIIMVLLTGDEVSKIHGRFNAIDSKLDKLDAIDSKLDKLDAIDSKLNKLDAIDSKLNNMDSNLNSINTNLGSMNSTLKNIEDILGAQFGRN